MVVNPQTFNYRLTIGTLLIAILTLGGYSYSNYHKLKDHEAFLIEEKNVVEGELSKLVARYDVLMNDNETIESELKIAKERTQNLLDSLKYQKVSLQIISKYRKQIKLLNAERDKFMRLANSLKVENDKLHEKNYSVTRKLKEQSDYNVELTDRNLLLAENIKKGSNVTANSFNAKAFKVKASGKLIETTKAKRTDFIEVCFTLAENALAEAGQRDIYVQILNPNSNIVGDKSSKSFGDYTLIYSKKTTVNYNNEVLNICVNAKPGKDQKPFKKGTYYVNVFNNEKKLGSTKVILH